MFSKKSGTKTGTTVSNKYEIQNAKMYLLPRNFRSSHRRCSVKKGLQLIRKRLQYCEDFKNTYFEKHRERLLLKISFSVTNLTKVTADFFYLFKPFSILNFAMTHCFYHVTCFVKVYSVTFFSLKHYIFIVKKL